ncbi:hypothetical protein JGH11_14245 [Dysgonomonas sp. Marseille-P4677]|uniref:hypothetical protein n=1 Tax=Dysgonomonas sp. Marseille-P4677 TaxID=2364790 RepID=UPI0019127650|nr:hypothetical protein [Dysgonomonas sp. Marseille-P4677]MBK5722036.1 hypothetical protein [Dysgonomonas sp. Marseille-P4677]
MRKKKKKTTEKITVEDYIKAVKRADRENELARFTGWKRVTSIHKSKKAYNRKIEKRNFTDE